MCMSNWTYYILTVSLCAHSFTCSVRDHLCPNKLEVSIKDLETTLEEGSPQFQYVPSVLIRIVNASDRVIFPLLPCHIFLFFSKPGAQKCSEKPEFAKLKKQIAFMVAYANVRPLISFCIALKYSAYD